MKLALSVIFAAVLLYGCIQVVDKLPQPSLPQDVSVEDRELMKGCIELHQIEEQVLKEWAALPPVPSERRTQLERKLVLLGDGEKVCHQGAK